MGHPDMPSRGYLRWVSEVSDATAITGLGLWKMKLRPGAF
jgi:hypothetical protein